MKNIKTICATITFCLCMVCSTVVLVNREQIKADREKEKILLKKEKERPLKIWEKTDYEHGH